jgi:hydrogenase nickel incorporation protein HypB
MCGSCGCADTGVTTIHDMQTGQRTVLARTNDPAEGSHLHEPHHDQGHSHADGHHHHHTQPGATMQVHLEQRILAKNDAKAGLNRAWLTGRDILALNLVSSPGAGKTTLIERTIRDLKREIPICVIEGDQATANDGDRIRKAGAPAIQVNTGSGCHLEADMVEAALRALKPAAGSLLIIENVGNLVCPALFDLGERSKVLVFSVTEGDDKPLKYPHMFAAADVLIINKTDLLPHVDFDMAAAVANARQINPHVTIFELSTRTGEGLERWYDWLLKGMTLACEAAFARSQDGEEIGNDC